jgi:hypothetical protein
MCVNDKLMHTTCYVNTCSLGLGNPLGTSLSSLGNINKALSAFGTLNILNNP